MRRTLLLTLASALATLLAGCGDDGDGGAPDSGGPTDAGSTDAGSTDASGSGDSGAAPDAGTPDAGPIRAMWVWDSATRLLEDDAAQDAFFAWAAAPHGRAEATVHRLFLEARDYDKGTEPFAVRTDYLAAPDRTALRAFVARARGQGIDVDYLDGQAHWARTAGRDGAVAVAQAVIDYNAAVEPDERFVGIHLDIEPHQLAEWRVRSTDCCDGSRPDCYSDELQENILYVAREVRRRMDEAGSGMDLTFDIGTDYAICAPDLVEPLATAGPTHLGIMNYFDDVDRYVNGEGGLGGVDQNLDLITELPLFFGVETICPPHAPDPMTLCEEGEPALEALLGEILERYGDEPNFAGVAVHHYDSWRTLGD